MRWESEVSSRLASPEVLAPFVGVVEIVCGSLLLIGLITRLAAIPLLMLVLVLGRAIVGLLAHKHLSPWAVVISPCKWRILAR
jgi:uncharacterized membrane protein YphA (DoxX/SURF4 family)